LAVLVLLDGDLPKVTRQIFFILFSFSIIVSHYSTSYLFLLILLLAWFGVSILCKCQTKWLNGGNRLGILCHIDPCKRRISVLNVLLYLAILFFWFSEVTVAAFNCGIGFGAKTMASLTNFFLFEARSGSLSRLAGRDLIYGLPHQIHVFFNWITWAMIGIGVIVVITSVLCKSRCRDLSNNKSLIEIEHLFITLICCSLLVFTILLPFVSLGYDMQRLYLMVAVILSACFIFGCIKVSTYLNIQPYLVVLIILMPYLMCTTGVMYQYCGIPKDLTLNSVGHNYERYVIHEGESSGAKWLEKYTDINSRVYTTPFGFEVLFSQGAIPDSRLAEISIDTFKQDYAFIRYENMAKGEKSRLIFTSEDSEKRLDLYLDYYSKNNRIFDSNHSTVFIGRN